MKKLLKSLTSKEVLESLLIIMGVIVLGALLYKFVYDISYGL